MKKIISLVQISAVLLIICCGVFFYFNGSVEVKLLNPELTLPLWSLKLGSFLTGIIAGMALCGIFIKKQSDKFSALERRNEKKEIKADDNEAKIKVLENKIASLEKALDKALGKN
ncbi:LapA family protein [bacterium]|nr:LapA family protein [bacterium]